MDDSTDDATLRKKTLLAVITMGGGCALFLALLGTGSWLIARASSDHATTTSAATELSSPAMSSPASPTARPGSPGSLPHNRKGPSSI